MRQNTAVSGDAAPLERASTDTLMRAILRDVLGLDGAQVAQFEPDTMLFGALPELDSMAVAGLLTEIEDRLAIVIDDSEVDGELLGTYGSLLAFAEAKRLALPGPVAPGG